ncbi:Alpha/Beta hydrolase protein [Tricharina praecox]|uniref:Alpha/Beta hydrolase protein n=1 Tax=Tricharina praecox TaxID=43433 RepID=UPI002220FC5C|nr:Alpha/Beta hydrolase protein [Tricharina praecox]KAI5857834.1 Alpha/Beta hydrolase protein [Tricharina praecox]
MAGRETERDIEADLGTEHLPGDSGAAFKALSVTHHDTVIETADGHRLPGVPLSEAKKLNALRSNVASPAPSCSSEDKKAEEGGNTTIEMAPAFTDPLFPPVPVYGPATPLRRLQCAVFRVTSGILSLSFLGVVVMGAIAESLPEFLLRRWKRVTLEDPDQGRLFRDIEMERKLERERNGQPDELKCDIAYYAQRVGLDAELLTVETEDGFLLDLWHVFDPQNLPYYPPEVQDGEKNEDEDEAKEHTRTRLPRETGKRPNGKSGGTRYPVLLIHGLLQSAGAYCVNDEDSLAFHLVRSGYDVFLGNNRCGFNPRHTVLHYSDPRMWAWNIRQMGILDLPAFIFPILSLTGYPKVALVAHSQGTTQTFVALAKQQRPDLGEKISVFCALAPAVYAGPLINKFYFKFMKLIPPSAFRIVFGIHAFIPFMLLMHRIVPAKFYGELGYRVFWFLFGWSDLRWDRGLRARFFQFAPVYVSAEAMRWWLGRECFAKHRCILSTHSAGELETRGSDGEKELAESPERGGGAWFDNRFPKLALWVTGADDLVDGRKLVRRFEEGREPEVDLVWKSVLEEYEHLDVIWAIDAKKRVFDEVVDVIGTCKEEEERK